MQCWKCGCRDEGLLVAGRAGPVECGDPAACYRRRAHWRSNSMSRVHEVIDAGLEALRAEFELQRASVGCERSVVEAVEALCWEVVEAVCWEVDRGGAGREAAGNGGV